MGAGHGHGHSDGRGGVETASGRHRTRLMISFAMVATFFVVELLAGIVTGSLALVSDAGHMAADVVALGAALVATRIATRPDSTGRRTYGSYRAEVFASGFTVLLMLGTAAYVGVEAVRRIGEPVTPSTGPMLVVGAAGLLVNLVAMALLRGGARESLAVKGAYLEVVADTAGSVGVIVAGLLVGLVHGRLGDLLGHGLADHLDDDAVGDLDLDVRRGLFDLGHGAEDPGGQHHPVTRLEVELELTSLLRTLLLRPDQQEVEQDDDDDERKEFHGGSAPTV